MIVTVSRKRVHANRDRVGVVGVPRRDVTDRDLSVRVGRAEVAGDQLAWKRDRGDLGFTATSSDHVDTGVRHLLAESDPDLLIRRARARTFNDDRLAATTGIITRIAIGVVW